MQKDNGCTWVTSLTTDSKLSSAIFTIKTKCFLLIQLVINPYQWAESEETTTYLNTEVSPVYVVTEEEITCVTGRSPHFKQLHKVKELAMDISTYCEQGKHTAVNCLCKIEKMFSQSGSKNMLLFILVKENYSFYSTPKIIFLLRPGVGSVMICQKYIYPILYNTSVNLNNNWTLQESARSHQTTKQQREITVTEHRKCFPLVHIMPLMFCGKQNRNTREGSGGVRSMSFMNHYFLRIGWTRGCWPSANAISWELTDSDSPQIWQGTGWTAAEAGAVFTLCALHSLRCWEWLMYSASYKLLGEVEESSVNHWGISYTP